MSETIPFQPGRPLFDKGHVINLVVGNIPVSNPFCPAEGHNDLMAFFEGCQRGTILHLRPIDVCVLHPRFCQDRQGNRVGG